MAVIGLTPALLSTAGFALALLAEFAFGLPVALEFPTLGVVCVCVRGRVCVPGVFEVCVLCSNYNMYDTCKCICICM